MVAGWLAVHEQEIKDCKEWLLLELVPETDSFQLGNATLSLVAHNRSGAIAKNVRLRLDALDHLAWHSADLSLPGLLQGQSERRLRTDFHIQQPGRHLINGTLTALDLDERRYEWPVNFVIHARRRGKPYQLAEKAYYVVGLRLSSDQLFVGREQLLREIRRVWQEPANK